MRLGLVVALPEEVRAVMRTSRTVWQAPRVRRRADKSAAQVISGQGQGVSLTLAWAGAGEACAFRSAAALLAAGVDALLAVGFAGALDPVLRPGDLLLSTQIMVEARTRWPADSSLLEAVGIADLGPAAPAAATRSTGGPPRLHRGLLVTLPRVITMAEEKRRLGEETGALAVDMESAGVARRAAEARVPMAALRVITDSADESLPLDFNWCLDSDGQFHYGRLILLLARRPLALGGLVRLGRHSALAGQSLASFLAECLPRIAQTETQSVDPA